MSENIAKTIQIFLPDGNPRSIKIAEITSRTVKTMLIPRSRLYFAAGRDELNNVGIYFLIGKETEGVKPLVYIGEAENCLIRLNEHNRNKDFWNTAIAVISIKKDFTKSHIKYLEWFCYQQAEKAGRYQINNPNIPTKSHITESMEADLLDHFETIKVLISTLGYPVFDEIQKPIKKDILICKGKDAYAEGEYTEDGLIVFAGSKCNLLEVKSLKAGIVSLRKRLMEEGILKQDGNVLVFKQDYIFESPSGASDVILANSSNGWKAWKYKNGKTLDEVKRQG
ncbi:MAG: GIY-YIG nuclease family protein [Planctomycetota bacterium]